MARPRGVWKKLRKGSTWSFTVSGRSWEMFLAASSARTFSRGSIGKVISATSSIAAGTAGASLKPSPARNACLYLLFSRVFATHKAHYQEQGDRRDAEPLPHLYMVRSGSPQGQRIPAGRG